MAKKIQKVWFGLIDQYGLYEQSATVEVKFQICPDGTIQNLEVSKTSGSQLLGFYCMKAVEDSGPFDPLPDDLHRLSGDGPRDATFTFYY